METSLAVAERLTAYFQDTSPRDWWRGVEGRPNPMGLKGHVFLLGFPRSGTTMLGQALATHPDVVTLDERETLADAADALLSGSQGLDRLATLSAEDQTRFVDLYWRRVREAGCDPRGKVFVDKLPMNTLGLPLITKLFPGAKILFLRRDPRDVVLSCVRRQFVLNPTTYAFLTLDGAAQLYDAVMGLAQIYERTLELNLRTQGYEALVEDFEVQTHAICDFIGLDWTTSLADFSRRAGQVATPSSAQIARGLSNEGIGVWRRYREQLAPVNALLAPWVERFGYPA